MATYSIHNTFSHESFSAVFHAQSESLQAELDILKEKNEELSVELELMKAEIDSGGIGGEGGGVTTYEMKQLEQQNDRLKEAVMKFRDLSQHEKQENGRLVKVRIYWEAMKCL